MYTVIVPEKTRTDRITQAVDTEAATRLDDASVS